MKILPYFTLICSSLLKSASAGFNIWRFKVTRDGHAGHICINAFRFIRLDGSIAIPIAVQATTSGDDYGQDPLNDTFNVNDLTGINESPHWCGWGKSDIIVTFANEETFGSYKFIPGIMAMCSNDPQTWYIEGMKTDDQSWTHLSDENHDCPLPIMYGYNEFDIGIMAYTSSSSSTTSLSSLAPSDSPSKNPSTFPSVSSQPSNIPTAYPSSSSLPTSFPSDSPTRDPSLVPSNLPSTAPSIMPSSLPSGIPSLMPSNLPSSKPSLALSSAPSSAAAETHFTFPATEPTGGFVHGLCVIGASSAQANSNVLGLTYTKVTPFVDDTQGWGDRTYVYTGTTFSPCFEGIFLRPSKIEGYDQGTVIDITVVSEGSSDTQICAILEKNYTRNGGWPTSLPPLGFDEYDSEGFKMLLAQERSARTFCKVLVSKPSINPSASPAASPSTMPSKIPSNVPSSAPSISPSLLPSVIPSDSPTHDPSLDPSNLPSTAPSIMPSSLPSGIPSLMPSNLPSSKPSSALSSAPSSAATSTSSESPSINPSDSPSFISLKPSLTPSLKPSRTPSMTLPDVNEWFMSDAVNITHEIVSSDIIAIKLPFNASYREIGVEVFKKDCITSFDNADYPYFIVQKSKLTSSKADGFIQFNTTMEVNVTAINGTDYWNAFTDGEKGGWAEACVETSLIFQDNIDLGNPASPQKVVFKNNILNISVSLTANYEVEGVNVQREVATEEYVDSDYSEFITAYECDEGSLYTKKTSATYNQGDEITICVTDNSIDIVQVEKFINLSVDQSDNTPYNFISNGLWNPDITTLVCVDGATSATRRVCYAKIRALARFFFSENPSDLSIRGTVFVVRDGRRMMRKLRNTLPSPDKTNNENSLNTSNRRVQENNEKGEFELEIGLTNANVNAASNSMVKSTAMAIGVAGVALLV